MAGKTDTRQHKPLPTGAAENCKGLHDMICPVSAGGTSSPSAFAAWQKSPAKRELKPGACVLMASGRATLTGVLEDAELP